MLSNNFGKPTIRTYEILNKQIDQMKRFEVSPPKGVNYDEHSGVKPHRCFETAQNFINVNLVNFLPMVYVYCFWSEEPLMDHAFVLINQQIVYDGVLNKFYNKDDYYREMRIVEVRIKTPAQVVDEHANSFDISQKDWTARLKYM